MGPGPKPVEPPGEPGDAATPRGRESTEARAAALASRLVAVALRRALAYGAAATGGAGVGAGLMAAADSGPVANEPAGPSSSSAPPVVECVCNVDESRVLLDWAEVFADVWDIPAAKRPRLPRPK